MPPLSKPFAFPLAPREITARRAKLLRGFTAAYPELDECPVRRIPAEFWSALPRAYDHLFLQGALGTLLPDLCVVPAPRMTSCGGKFCVAMRGNQRVRCEIRMATDFLLRLERGPFSLNGLAAQTALEAFLIVFEHELCHALDLALNGHLSAHGKPFRTLVHGLFGHTACRHNLPTRAREAALNGVMPGVRVGFMHQGQRLTGIVARVGKTVSVMVPCATGEYRDVNGRRYEKYRVPPEQVTPVQ